MSIRSDRQLWNDYIAAFHERRPGITEAVLSRCIDERGATPYEWLTADVGTTDRVLDIACGSAPTRPLVPGCWIGVDRAASELRTAVDDHHATVARGDAVALPIRSGSVDVVLVSMALMLIDPLSAALAEIHRVLVPGGELRALIPTTSPMTIGDRFVYARLAVAARAIPRFPPTPLDRDLDPLEDAGLTVTADDKCRFTYPLADSAATRQFIDSWYTHRTPTELDTRTRGRIRLADPTVVAVPLRLVTAHRGVQG